MSESDTPGASSGDRAGNAEHPVVNYSLRHAKNIQRKMMGEAFARLATLSPLSAYRYIGMGSEFFNDFALYHETLGIQTMVSIEEDRFERCKFNLPYGCIKLKHGHSKEILPTLGWRRRSIVWLDYMDKLADWVLKDIRLVVSCARSGSLLVWSVNAHPWDAGWDYAKKRYVGEEELPSHRKDALQESMLPRTVPAEWLKLPLSAWGLASVYYRFIVDEIAAALGDRNASAKKSDKLIFRQCFHFHYQDGQKMLTVGGILLNAADAKTIGSEPFAGLPFERRSTEAMEIKPPLLTGREVRYLSRILPDSGKSSRRLKWIERDAFERFKEVYRYYPIFAESEL